MNIVVPVKLVPDLVEELAIDASGTRWTTTWLRRILSEFDDHAIEQAILLKERDGGQVTVITPDVEGADDALFAAAAKGADRLVKLSGDFGAGVNNHALARALVAVVRAAAAGPGAHRRASPQRPGRCAWAAAGRAAAACPTWAMWRGS